MDRLYTRTAVTMALAVLLSAATGGCRSIYRLFKAEEQVDATAVAKFWDGPRICPGMTLIIQVGAASVKQTQMNVIVDQKGEVLLPYLLDKPVAVDGLGLEELRKKLEKLYGEYIRQPQITVTFGEYDGRSGVSPWGTVTVMGEVGTPGPVNMPRTMDMTVTKLIQVAGGLKPYANKSAIVVIRCDKEGRQTRTKVDLDEIGQDGRFDKDMVLKAGDVIYVPESWY